MDILSRRRAMNMPTIGNGCDEQLDQRSGVSNPLIEADIAVVGAHT